MSRKPITDSNGNTIDDYPDHREDGDQVLFALVDGSPDTHARYYLREEHRVDLVLLEGGEIERIGHHQLGENETIGDHVREIQESSIEHELTTFARAMVRAEKLADTGAITQAQAEVYALRAEHGVLRDEASKLLGKKKSTLDSLLLKAKDKIERADRLTRESVGSITFEGESAPLFDTTELNEDDLLTTAEFEEILGTSLVSDSEDGYVVVSTPDGSFYIVGSSADGGPTEIHGVVSVADANDAYDLV